MTRRLLTTLVALTSVAGLAAAEPERVIREGAGSRREKLDQMELTPFNQTLWSSMTDWTGGEPLNPTTTDGKVVVIYTWASYLNTSVRPMSIVRRIIEKYGDQGVVAVGLHSDEGWDGAAEVAEKRRANFPIAHDKGDAVRKALHSDQDPDFYIIDRAGQLRFADVDTASVERAVAQLVEESSQYAAATLDRMAEAERKAAEAARRAAPIRQNVSLDRLPASLPFPPPSEEAYAAADWPKMWKLGDIEKLFDLSSADREEDEPRPIPLPEDAEWVPGKPDTKGKITVVYFFTEEQRASWIGLNYGGIQELFNEMQKLQELHPRDLAVIGAIERHTNDSRRRDDDSNAEEQRRKAERIFNSFARLNYLNHTMLNDWEQGAVLQAVRGDSRSRNGEWPISYVALIDSSGTLRYHNTIALDTTRDEFNAALRTMLNNDPGVLARRAAEAEYLRKLRE